MKTTVSVSICAETVNELVIPDTCIEVNVVSCMCGCIRGFYTSRSRNDMFCDTNVLMCETFVDFCIFNQTVL